MAEKASLKESAADQGEGDASFHTTKRLLVQAVLQKTSLYVTYPVSHTTMNEFRKSMGSGDEAAVLLPAWIMCHLLEPHFQWSAVHLSAALGQLIKTVMSATRLEQGEYMALSPFAFKPLIGPRSIAGSTGISPELRCLPRVTDLTNVPELVVEPSIEFGIANRVNVIAAAYWLSHVLKLNLRVRWIKSEWCPCAMKDIFAHWWEHANMPSHVLVQKITVEEFNCPPINYKLHTANNVWTFFAMAKPIVAHCQEYLKIHCDYKHVKEPQWPPIAPFLTLVTQPRQDIQQHVVNYMDKIVSSYKSGCVTAGFHIRKGDLKTMLEKHAKGQGYNAKATEIFVMKQLVSFLHDATCTYLVFIACDTFETYNALTTEPLLKPYLNSKLHFSYVHADGWNKRDHMNCPVADVELDSHIRETSQAAFMVDMIMLSLCQQFHYSNESTCKALVYALK
jgi:hypothetical protein